MFTGIYKIADTVISITSLYQEVQQMCADYAFQGQPELTVCTDPESIRFEQERSDRENRMAGKPLTVWPDSYLETLAVYRQIANFMVTRGTLLFHGSVIAVDGQAYLFTAASGTGKSTHTRLWRELLGDRAVMVNDDKPLLHVTEQGVTVYGTPWNGKHRLGNNMSAPLKAICILERGQKNEIHQVSVRDALPMLLQQSYRAGGPAAYPRLMQILDTLTKTVHLYRLHCNMEPDAARVAYEGMSGQRI